MKKPAFIFAAFLLGIVTMMFVPEPPWLYIGLGLYGGAVGAAVLDHLHNRNDNGHLNALELSEAKQPHHEDCFIGQHPGWEICPVNNKPHRWSGWPGAYCLNCFAEDLTESCLGNVCRCWCHDEFWRSYNEAELKAHMLDLLEQGYAFMSRPQKPSEELKDEIFKVLKHHGRNT